MIAPPIPQLRPYLTLHALERYREFYPLAEEGDLVAAFLSGTEIEPETAFGLLGRNHRAIRDRHRAESVYLLHPERTGLFVSVRIERPFGFERRIITFMRFYSYQQYELAARLWPTALMPTCSASWRYLLEPPQPQPEETLQRELPIVSSTIPAHEIGSRVTKVSLNLRALASSVLGADYDSIVLAWVRNLLEEAVAHNKCRSEYGSWLFDTPHGQIRVHITIKNHKTRLRAVLLHPALGA